METIHNISTNDFILDTTTGKYTCTVLADAIGLNGSRFFHINKFLRNVSGTYHNIVLAYEINTSGDLIIHSDEAFAGRLILAADNS